MNTRKLSVFLIVLLALSMLVGCSGMNNVAETPTPGPQTLAPALEDNTISASGEVVPQKWVTLTFPSGGQNLALLVAVGDKVEAGQLLASLDDTDAQTQLALAKRTLNEMTSPEAIANAKLAITTAQANVTNAQTGLNNLQYWKNDALIQEQYANLVVAKASLDQAQAAYDRANVGEYINNEGEAALYQSLYNAQKVYDNAKYYYSLYSQKPTQRQIDETQATLDLAKALLTNAQNYLTALTGGEISEDATGSALEQLKQAQLNVQNAEDTLKATKLNSPFSGSIVEIDGRNGEIVSPGQPLIVLADLSTLQVETTDMSEIDTARVHIGDTAEVSFDALPNISVTGKVVQIALKKSPGSGVYYTVTIALDTIPDDLRWGMSAFVVIKIK